MLHLLVTLSKFLLLAIRSGTTSGLIFPTVRSLFLIVLRSYLTFLISSSVFFGFFKSSPSKFPVNGVVITLLLIFI